MNTAGRAGFDAFFDLHYASVVDSLTEVFDDRTVARDEARSAFASTYQFWKKRDPRDDPLAWTLAEALAHQRQRTNAVHDSKAPTVSEFDLRVERRVVLALARRRKVIATVVLGAVAVVLIAAEIFIAR
ncbi:MAG: hypothetical protein HY826_11435 [Actinobacteria bacterium]|nr:hypothetical protein [Actinomycetota bacterium]